MRNVTRMPTRWKCFRCIFVKKSGCVCVCVFVRARVITMTRWRNIERWGRTLDKTDAAFPSSPFTDTDNPPCPLIYSYTRVPCTSSRMESVPVGREREGEGGEGTVFGYNIIISSLTSSMEKRNTYNFLNMYVCMFLRMIVGYIFGYKSSRGDI